MGAWKGSLFMWKSFEKSGLKIDLPKGKDSWQTNLGQWQSRLFILAAGTSFFTKEYHE